MRRSIRKRSSTSEPTKASFFSPAAPALLRAIVGKKAPSAGRSLRARAVAILPRQPTVPPGRAVSWSTRLHAARADVRVGPAAAPNASRSCCGACLRWARRWSSLILIVLGVKGCLDARARGALSDYSRDVESDRHRDEPDEQRLLQQAGRPGHPLGHRIHRPGRRRPQRDGQLQGADRRAERAGRAERRAEVARTRVHAARLGDGTRSRAKMPTALGEAGAAKATPAIAGRCRTCSPPTSSTKPSPVPKSTASSPTKGSRATTCRRAPSSPTGPSGWTKTKWRKRSARSAARRRRTDHRRGPRARPARGRHRRKPNCRRNRPTR